MILSCTKKESDSHYPGQGGIVYKWIKSIQYNDITGLMDTIRPTEFVDSIFILDTGYFTIFRGDRIMYRADIIEEGEFINNFSGPCNLGNDPWEMFTFEDGTAAIRRQYLNEPISEIRFGTIENNNYMEFDCERIDLYNTEIIEF